MACSTGSQGKRVFSVLIRFMAYPVAGNPCAHLVSPRDCRRNQGQARCRMVRTGCWQSIMCNLSQEHNMAEEVQVES